MVQNANQKPWRDADELEYQYWDLGKSIPQVADSLGCSIATVYRWMEKHGIERRDASEACRGNNRNEYACLYMDSNGYMTWDSYHPEEHCTVAVHQLLVIAEGVDPRKVFSNREYHIHHENGIPWDNRPENLELLTSADHIALHNRER